MAVNFGVNIKINWSALGVPDNLDWDVILAAFSVNVGKNFLAGVKHL